MKMIKDEDKKYLLSLQPDDLTLELLISLLGDVANSTEIKDKVKVQKSKFNCQDAFELSPNEYFNKEKVLTTVGKLIYNKYIVERLNLQEVLGYVNDEITDPFNYKIEDILSRALMDDEITVDTFIKYIDCRDNFAQQMHIVLTTSYTMNVLKTPPQVQKHKEELFKQHEKELKNGDLVVASKIEKTLLAEASELLKGDIGMDLYTSGARGSFKNNYKNINIMKGPVFNNITGRYDIVQSSFMDGIRKEDIAAFGNSVVAGAYPKAVGTQVSGYMAKQLLAALQTEVLDVAGSDCGTKRYLDFTITEKNKDDFKYRFIVENGKLVELTPKVISSYVGKTVKLRSIMMCVGDKICNHCAGNIFYKLGIETIGLTASRVANTFTNLNMKKFHDSTVSSRPIDINDLIM